VSFHRLKLTAMLAALALGAAARAQNEQPPNAAPGATAPFQNPLGSTIAPLPQFQIEVLIFSHRDFDPSEEQFAHNDKRGTAPRDIELRPAPVFDDTNFGPNATSPSPLDQTAVPGAVPPPAGDPAVADANAFTFRLLRPDELQLTKEFRTLERVKDYHPLVHGGWIQLGLPESQAPAIDLAVLGSTNPVGTITVYLSRFLHAKLDVSYLDTASPLAAAPPGSAGSAAPAAPGGFGALAEVPLAPRYHLTQERQMRSGELHYFDHPAFGVLIKITPVRPDPNGNSSGRPAA
jgi:hypothetical protein